MYNYQTERSKLFTDEGQRALLQVRDHVQKCLKVAGCVRMEEAVSVISGDSWFEIACVDRLVELGEIREVEYAPGKTPCGQYRLFVSNKGSA